MVDLAYACLSALGVISYCDWQDENEDLGFAWRDGE